MTTAGWATLLFAIAFAWLWFQHWSWKVIEKFAHKTIKKVNKALKTGDFERARSKSVKALEKIWDWSWGERFDADFAMIPVGIGLLFAVCFLLGGC